MDCGIENILKEVAMKFEKLKPGMVVYDVRRYKMGNTTVSSIGIWEVRIVSVDSESKTVVAEWNNNPAKKYFGCVVEKWRAKKPLLIRGAFGSHRLATREEIKAAKCP